ncbi:MAG: hypothetical protein P8X95_27315 [Anaerolineales bacterium]|jgi:hypothetical protein
MKVFNPERIANYEANGWRAYYDRKWLRLLRLIVALAQEEFRIPFPNSLLAAYYITRASAAWVPVDHDARVVQAHYEKFYRLARRYSGLIFDPAQVGALELKYNDVHRRLAGEADKTEFIETMVELHSALFDIGLDQALESAELRVKANNTVDLITSGASSDVEGDWERIEAYLTQCYHSIERAREFQKGS